MDVPSIKWPLADGCPLWFAAAAGKEIHLPRYPTYEPRVPQSPRPEAQSLRRSKIRSPGLTIDRMLWPVIETAQILRRTYGMSTYVARRQ